MTPIPSSQEPNTETSLARVRQRSRDARSSILFGFYIRNVQNIVNPVKAGVVGVANRTTTSLSVLEDMALPVIKLVAFHIEPLKQRVGLYSDNSIAEEMVRYG